MVPVISKGNYIGNMEIILFTKYFIKVLKNLEGSEKKIIFIVNGDTLKEKLSSDGWKNYIKSPIEGWWFEKRLIPDKDELLFITKLSHDEKFLQKLKMNKEVSYSFKENDEYYRTIILPFKELNNKTSAIILIIRKR
ncbi:MAG: hypothetical protein J7K20_03960 [Thermodesulfobacterium sp.]|nr:hypothetical protein [Thermodesulfobacterium sp.]